MSELLIEAHELKQALLNDGLFIFDVRHNLFDPQEGFTHYTQGHIPGAAFLNQDTDLASPLTGTNGRHPLPDPNALLRILKGLGVASNSRIVVYDAADSSFAVRAWWLLRWLGYTNVAVLNGGWQAWCNVDGSKESGSSAAQQRIEQLKAASTTADLATPKFFMPSINADNLLKSIKAKQITLIDARDPVRYRGESEPMDPVAGRIPTALNRPIKENLQADGTFKPANVLKAEFAQIIGNAQPAQVVHYCGSGVTACHNVFSMELAGLTGSVLYPGSWSEWCSDSARPTEQG